MAVAKLSWVRWFMGVWLQRMARFLSGMNTRTATSLAATLLVLGFLFTMLVFGQRFFNLGEEGGLSFLFETIATSPFAIFGVITVYAILALTGFPQVLLITATIFWFGPWNGAAYAWLATMVSASLTFGIGRFLGGDWVHRRGGERTAGLISFLRRRGIVACALIRVVPSAPFIVVNGAAGAAKIPLWKFWGGSGVGIIPKIAFIAILGAVAPEQLSLKDGTIGVSTYLANLQPIHIVLATAVIALWIALMMVARRVYLNMRHRDGIGPDS